MDAAKTAEGSNGSSSDAVAAAAGGGLGFAVGFAVGRAASQAESAPVVFGDSFTAAADNAAAAATAGLRGEPAAGAGDSSGARGLDLGTGLGGGEDIDDDDLLII